jgi:hypothetical protein
MEQQDLGPNGAMIYCIDYLAHHVDWLIAALASPACAGRYVLFDLPGQIETYSAHDALTNIVTKLTLEHDWRLCSVHLCDSTGIRDPGVFTSLCLLSLSQMVRLELPALNVLTKIDLLPHDEYGRPLAVPLDPADSFVPPGADDSEFLARPRSHLLSEFTDGEAAFMVPRLTHESSRLPPRFKALTTAIADVCTDFSLVAFLPLAIENKDTVGLVAKQADAALGYIYGCLGEPPLDGGGAPLAQGAHGGDAAQVTVAAAEEERKMFSQLSDWQDVLTGPGTQAFM